MTRTTIAIETRDGRAQGTVFRPDIGEGPWPSVLVYHDGRGIRQRAHQRASATGVVEMDVREEQVVDGTGLETELRQCREYQRNGRVRAGVHDGRTSARDDDVGRIHLGAHVLGIDRRDSFGV